MRTYLALMLTLIYGSVLWGQPPKTVHISFTYGLETTVPAVELHLQKGVIQKILTNKKGYTLYLNSDFSEGLLEVECVGCSALQIPIRFGKKQNHIDLGNWSLRPEEPEELHLPMVSLADWEAQQTGTDREQLGWVLQAQRDPFLTAAAFQFSSAFFRLRGLDTSHQSIRINGIPMNNPVSQRPNWSQWGGLNDFTNAGATQHYGLEPSDFDMGGALGSLHWELKPSSLRKGIKFSQAFSNANYRNRTMFSQVYHKKEWSYGLLLSLRQGEEGYQEGTSYRAYSLAALLERQWNAQHQSWGALLYTPNRRGKSAPLTQEVFSLKGRRYNPYWGWYKGKKRNARTKETQAPQLFISHLFQPQENTQWRLNYSLAWVRVGQTRIFHQGSWIEGGALVGGGFNPDPVYYQKLPSYFLREASRPDYEKNYWAREGLLHDGQLNWERLYQSNEQAPVAIYALLSDEEVSLQNSFSLQFQKKLSPYWRFSSEWLTQLSQNRFWVRPTSLLGASLLQNLYPYAQSVSEAPHNLHASDAALEKGEPFGYHYALQLLSHQWNAHMLMEKPGLTLFFAGQMGYQSHFREGYFQNGRYPETSYGKGAKQRFWSSHWKAGLTYSLSGLHHFNLRLGYQTRPPSLAAQYLNPRERYFINPFIAHENIFALEVKYQLTTEPWRGQLTTYFIDHQKGHQQGFYYADGIRGQEAFFVQEYLNDIHQTRLGIEFAGRYQPLEEVSIDWAMALGDFRYQNNPRLLQLTDPSPESEQAGFRNGWQDFGSSYLKGYPLARGPQQAFSMGFTYNDPKYWRMGLTLNHFRKAFVAINAFRRTQNFYQDFDGQPFADYSPQHANELLQPEELPTYSTLNLIGSKSWKWGKQYFGFFISLQNILNTHYKTGGFEQARNANYRTVEADHARAQPLFAPKYWWGRGTTFFASIYYRFP